jgi:hypothetical protein
LSIQRRIKPLLSSALIFHVEPTATRYKTIAGLLIPSSKLNLKLFSLPSNDDKAAPFLEFRVDKNSRLISRTHLEGRD